MLDAVAAVALGAEGLGGAVKGGLLEAAGHPGPQVGSQGLDVPPLVGEVAGQAARRVRDRLDQVGQAAGVVP